MAITDARLPPGYDGYEHKTEPRPGPACFERTGEPGTQTGAPCRGGTSSVDGDYFGFSLREFRDRCCAAGVAARRRGCPHRAAGVLPARPPRSEPRPDREQ